MSSNYNKLRGKIREAQLTNSGLAQLIGISATSLSNKLNGKVDFTLTEIRKILIALNIPPTEMNLYFFNV